MSPSPSEIRSAVARILASEPFVHSRRMQQFLHFIVESTLAGNLDHLKETVIGIEVFSREPGYDPKLDSVVRTEARRLRSKLEQYYGTEGTADTLIIHLHKGGYVPIFEVGKIGSTPLQIVEMELPSKHDPTPIAAPDHFLAPLTSPPQSPAQVRHRFPLWAVAITLTAVPICWHAFTRTDLRPSLRVVPLTGNAGAEITPALSPDGRQIAYAWKKDGGEFDVYVKLVDLGDPVRLTANSGHNVSPSWSPDGQRIAFLRAAPSRTEIIVVPALGGSEKVAFTTHGGFDQWEPRGPRNWGKSGPVWSKDGQSLIVCEAWDGVNCGLTRVDLNGGSTRLTEPERGLLDFLPAVSPDGKSIAFVRGIPGAGDLYIVPSKGGTPRRLTNDYADIGGISWRNAETLLFGSTRGGNMGLWQIKLSGQAPTAVSFATGSGIDSPSVDTSNQLIAYVSSTEQQSIWRRSLTAATLLPAERFISSARHDHSPKYSPDGTRIAFVSDRSGAWEVWSCRNDGSHPVRLTSFGGAPVGSPRWSPDGHSLVFDAKVGRYSEIWLLDVVAGTAPRRLNQSNSDELIPSWSRDGQWIYFISDRTKQYNLWMQNIVDGRAVAVSDETGLDAAESADGAYLYYEQNGRIWRMHRDGGTAAPVPELVRFPTGRNWAMTADGIYLALRIASPPSLGFLRFGGSALVNLGQINGDVVDGTPSLSVSPDGRWLLYAQQEPRRSNIMVAHRAHLN